MLILALIAIDKSVGYTCRHNERCYLGIEPWLWLSAGGTEICSNAHLQKLSFSPPLTRVSHAEMILFVGLFCKTELWQLAKCLASAWEVHDDWFMISYIHAISHDSRMTTRHVGDSRPSWARLCCFAAFIIFIVKSCCHINSALHSGSVKWSISRLEYVEIWSIDFFPCTLLSWLKYDQRLIMCNIAP